MSDQSTTILYLYGTGRSGTTVLARILGQVQGFTCVGELRWIWEQGFIGNHLCGCGVPFMECEFWHSVAQEAYGGFDQLDLDRVQRMTAIYPWNRSRPFRESLKYIPQLALSSKAPGYIAQFSEYSDILSNLYRAIQKVSGAQVIVDSSKDPSYLYALNALPNVDVRIAHIVRDSRAVAFSWARRKASPEKAGRTMYLPQLSPVKTAVSWLLHNSVFVNPVKRGNQKYQCVRYEDFVDNPEGAVRKILDLARVGNDGPEFSNHRMVDLEVNHTVSGNPMRFEQGPIEIRPDEEWKTGMVGMDRAVVSALTSPGLLKYGYLHRAVASAKWTKP